MHNQDQCIRHYRSCRTDILIMPEYKKKTDKLDGLEDKRRRRKKNIGMISFVADVD